MVSGLVTSPWLQLRIFSGDAREMRIESKSAIKFARSYGEDLKIASSLYQNLGRGVAETLRKPRGSSPRLRASRVENLVSCQSRVGHFLRLLHQFHIETQRLQFANQHVEGFR